MSPSETGKRRVTVDLSDEMVSWLDALKSELGLRSRGAILERVLSEIRFRTLDDDEEDEFEPVDLAQGDADAEGDEQSASFDDTERTALDEATAIVLIPAGLGSDAQLDEGRDQGGTAETDSFVAGSMVLPRGSRTEAPRSASSPTAGADGIQLPGFLRRQARELGRSLNAEPHSASDRVLPLISAADLDDALLRADQHWQEIYSHAASEAVLEAAMVWLAREIWPRSDQSEGRPFAWSLIQQVVGSVAPGWRFGEPSLSRVITAAGVLEDPFSGGTLAVRVPTLITRFVQYQRSRQKRNTSFEAIDQTMTVHAALRLLQLPTVVGRPYCLQAIREAYRQQAQNHHPDAGGSADAMRRINEAYQFLKDRYRRAA